MRASDDGYVVTTTEGAWRARTVVLANGACGVPDVPALAADLPTAVRSMAAADYRNPDQLEHGGVLIAGASATGIQLADEIHRSGRPVTLAVGGHVRAPRTYRGMDIMWWLDAAGILDERHDEVDDVTRVRSLPSFQLVGSPTRATDRPQHPPGERGPDRRPPRRRARRHRAAVGLAAEPVQARRPEARAAARRRSTSGPRRRGSTARSRRRTGPSRPSSSRARRSPSRSARARSGRSSGRPATGPTSPGSTCRCSTTRDASSTTAA